VELLPATGPSNDTCLGPLDAPLDGGAFDLDLSLASDNYTGSCNRLNPGSRDEVWRVTLPQRLDFHAVARGLGGVADPLLYLRANPCATGTELACVDSDTAATVEHLRIHGLDAGTYYL